MQGAVVRKIKYSHYGPALLLIDGGALLLVHRLGDSFALLVVDGVADLLVDGLALLLGDRLGHGLALLLVLPPALLLVHDVAPLVDHGVALLLPGVSAHLQGQV